MKEDDGSESIKSLFVPLTNKKAILWIIAIGFIVYGNMLFNGFVWDDESQILSNHTVQSVYNIPKLFTGSTFESKNSTSKLSGIYYRPLMSTSFSIIYSFFGANSFFFHLFQLTVHVVNTILVFVFFKKFLNKELAFLSAILFLVHPIDVEAVSFISALNDPLYFLFGISALVLSTTPRVTVRRSIVISILLLCSLLSKETGILFFIMVLIYHVIFKKVKNNTVKMILTTSIPLLIYFLIRFYIVHFFIRTQPDAIMSKAPIAQRIITMPAILFFYLKTFLLPKDLLINQEWVITHLTLQFFEALLIDTFFIAVVVTFGYSLYKRKNILFPSFIFFCTWFLSGILLHIQIFPLEMTVADRWFYFPIIGIIGMIAIGIQFLSKPVSKLRNLGLISIIIVLIVFSLRTISRNINWENNTSLYTHDLKYNKNDAIELNLATSLMDAKKYEDAQKYYEDLIKRQPENTALYINLGYLYQAKGNKQGAEVIYRKILDKDKTGLAYYNLAGILVDKNAGEAQALLNEGLKKFPGYGRLWEMAAYVDYQLGDQKNALNKARKANELIKNSETEMLLDSIQNKRQI